MKVKLQIAKKATHFKTVRSLFTFEQFLQSFPIIHITGIPYNPDTRHSQTNTSHTKVTNKKIKKGEHTGTLLSSLSKVDFTRF